MEYVIQKKNGYYVKRDLKGNITPVSNITLADRFTHDNAHKYIKNNISKKDKPLYTVVRLEETENDISLNTPLSPTIFDNMDFDWLEFCKSINSSLPQLKQYKINLSKKQSIADCEIQDYLHKLLFVKGKMNASQGYKLAKGLQDVVCKRAKIKSELMIVSYIVENKFENLLNGNVIKMINGLNNRKYEPRVLKELF